MKNERRVGLNFKGVYRLGVVLLISAGGLLLQSCSDGEARVQTDSRGWPNKIRIGHNPPEEETQRIARDEIYTALAKYLGDRLDVEVEILKIGSYNVAIEAMRADKVDIVTFGSFSYLIAHQKANAEPLVMRGSESKGRGEYRSLLITAADSEIQSMDDVLARAGDLTLSFNDPASTSGHLVPRGYFDEKGLIPEEIFKQVVFSMSHTANIMTAVSGKADLSAVASTTMRRMLETGSVKEDEFRIVWQSDWMPAGPVTIRGGLPEDFKEAVRDAYLSMPEDSPETWELVRSVYIDPDTVFYPGDDSVYDYYRNIARKLEHMRLLD